MEWNQGMGMAINPESVGVEWKREKGRGRSKKKERERERNEALSVSANRFEVATGGPFPIGTRRAVEPHDLIGLSVQLHSPPRPDRLYCYRVLCACAPLDLSLHCFYLLSKKLVLFMTG